MLFQADDPTAKTSVRDFDLSQNGSLVTLEVITRNLTVSTGYLSCAPDPAILSFLKTVLLTITSPAFSEVVAVFREHRFGGLNIYSPHIPNIYRDMGSVQREGESASHRAAFKAFREMYTVRDFRLSLCAEVWDRVGDYAVGVLKRAVAVEGAEKRLDYLPLEPTVVYIPRGSVYVEY